MLWSYKEALGGRGVILCSNHEKKQFECLADRRGLGCYFSEELMKNIIPSPSKRYSPVITRQQLAMSGLFKNTVFERSKE